MACRVEFVQNLRMRKEPRGRAYFALLAIFILATVGCRSNKPATNANEKMDDIQVPITGTDPGPAPLPFQIASGPAEWDVSKPTEWSCFASSGNRTVKFRLQVDALHPLEREMFSGKGRFVAEHGSDATDFLQKLASALSAKHLPKKSTQVQSLPFEIVVLGRNRAHKIPMGFSGPGTWTAAKLFFGQGESESEVFFNLDPAHHQGEFSMKDEEYGDAVLAELAKVL